MEESNRQKKIAGILQEDLAKELQEIFRASGLSGVLVSVTRVHVTADLGVAKAYVSIFPVDKSAALIKEIKEMSSTIRYNLANITRHQLRRMPEQHKYLRGQISWLGFNQTYIEYERDARHAGNTGYTYRKMIRFALDGITGFSDLPLKLVTFFGFVVTAFAFAVLAYVLLSRYLWQDYVQGWASTMITILFIGGIQMIAIGIIGEYLSRMNANIRQRPLYVIREKELGNEESTL